MHSSQSQPKKRMKNMQLKGLDFGPSKEDRYTLFTDFLSWTFEKNFSDVSGSSSCEICGSLKWLKHKIKLKNPKFKNSSLGQP